MLRANVNKTVNATVARISEDLRLEDAAVVISQPTAESDERVKYWTRGQQLREERRLKSGRSRQPDHVAGI